jgi:hypothetical protein
MSIPSCCKRLPTVIDAVAAEQPEPTLRGSSRSPKAVIDFVPKAAIDSMDGSDLAFSVSGP